MTLPRVLGVAGIRSRLEALFEPGIEMRQNLVREMAARTVFVFLYGGMTEGENRYLRPSHVYFFTKDQAVRLSKAQREEWIAASVKPGFRPAGARWYADTTREPIRDETIRFGLLHIGAVGRLEGVAVTSSRPIYYLKRDFAALFDPGLDGDALVAAMDAWRKKHLTIAARARMRLLAAGKVRSAGDVTVQCPDGTIAKLSPGPSSLISKGVIETFSTLFLAEPALLWLSESRTKVRYQDNEIAKALGLEIDQSTVLPDIILANVGADGEDTHLVFVEVVASDGPMTRVRRESLLRYVTKSGFPESQCMFGTTFEDRADSAFKKCLPQLAWGTFVWFRSEPKCLIWLYDDPFDIVKKAVT